MVPETRLEQTEHGLVPKGKGWFVLNAREAKWSAVDGPRCVLRSRGRAEFRAGGSPSRRLEPGDPMAMYHWEADQEDFLVLAGEALLIVEGEERSLKQWDFVHCPAGTKHVIVGGGQRNLPRARGGRA